MLLKKETKKSGLAAFGMRSTHMTIDTMQQTPSASSTAKQMANIGFGRSNKQE